MRKYSVDTSGLWFLLNIRSLQTARFALMDAFGNEMCVPRHAVSPPTENHTQASFMKPSFSSETYASSQLLSARDVTVTQYGWVLQKGRGELETLTLPILQGPADSAGLDSVSQALYGGAGYGAGEQEAGRQQCLFPSVTTDVHVGGQDKEGMLAHSEFPRSNRSCQMNSEQLHPAGRISLTLCLYNQVSRWHKSTVISHLNVFHFPRY